jgi:hypothetical protein
VSSASNTSPSCATNARSPEWTSSVASALSKSSSSLGAENERAEESASRVPGEDTLHQARPQQKANEAAIPTARSAPRPGAVEELLCTQTASVGPIDWSTRSAKPIPSRVGGMRPSNTSSSGSSPGSGVALGTGRFTGGCDVGAPAKCSDSSRLDGRGSSGCGENGLTRRKTPNTGVGCARV